MDKKNLSIYDISSISGNDTNDFIYGRLSKERSIEIIAIIEGIKQEIIPKLDSNSKKNIQLFIKKIYQCNNYKKIISELKQKRILTKKEKLALGLTNINKVKKSNKDTEVNNKQRKYLYEELMHYCKNFYDKYKCCCDKYGTIIPETEFWLEPKTYQKYYCEINESNYSKTYSCELSPYSYMLHRADRHASELIYAMKSVSKILKYMDIFKVLELGCGPATGLIATDYYVKKCDKKVINYLGIENNPIWRPIYDKIRSNTEYQNSEIFDVKNGNITENIDMKFKPNIIIISYVISWFYQKHDTDQIEKLFKNIINIVDINQPTIIIINDVNEAKKGVDEFVKIIDGIKNKIKNYTELKQSFYISPDNPLKRTKYIPYGRDYEEKKETNTLLRQDANFDYWKIEKGKNYDNICTSAQLIITIGGENDN